MYDIILGRSESDRRKFGLKGTVFLGKQYVKMGRVLSLANEVYMDVARSHVVFVSGKRGGGKSYTMGVIAEGMSDLDEEVKKNISVIMLDTMGIYWTMKYPNKQDPLLLDKWNLKAKPLDVVIYTPVGYHNDYKEKGIPTDKPFAIKPSELTPADWYLTFGVSANEAIGIVIEKTIMSLKEKSEDYSIQDIITALKTDDTLDATARSAAINRFLTASTWGLFAEEGTPITELSQPGQVTVLDVSCYATLSGGSSLRALVIGLISQKLFIQRMIAKKKEEYDEIEESTHFVTQADATEKRDRPVVWLVVDECLPYESEVVTSKNHTPIGQIVEKFEKGETITVFAYDEKRKQYGYYPVSDVFCKGKRKVIKLVTETGRELTCTPNHRVFTKKGFMYAVQAKEVGVPLTQHYDQNKTSIIARLCGHIHGDGWLSTNQVGFSGKDNDEDLDLIKKDLAALGFTSGKIYTRKTNSTIKTIHNKLLNVKGTSKSIQASVRVFRFFKKLGLPIGRKTDVSFSVPSFILEGSDKEKAEFLAALFGSDGYKFSVNKNVACDFNPIRLSFNKRIDLIPSALTYAEQLMRLLESFGITSKLTLRQGNIRKDNTKTMQVVITLDKSVENTIRFLEKMGYRYCSSKELIANKWLFYLKYRDYLKQERRKQREEAIRLYNEEGLTKAQICEKLGAKKSDVLGWINKGFAAWLPKKLPGFSEWVNSRSTHNTLFEKIISISDAGEQEVFDISVSEAHTFISNGCVVHNCHEFLPSEGKTAASDALITILREGRQPGISLILATQQPGKIHTDVMTQADIFISHRITAKHDTDALGMLMQSYMREGLDVQLDNLPRTKGAALIFDDTNERLYPAQIRPRFTWHGGEAPTALHEKKKLFDFEQI